MELQHQTDEMQMVRQPESQKSVSGQEETVHVKLQEQMEGEQVIRHPASMEQPAMVEISWKSQESVVTETWPDHGLLPLDAVPFIYEDLRSLRTASSVMSRAGAVRFPCSYRLSSIDNGRVCAALTRCAGAGFFLEHRVPGESPWIDV